MVFLSHCSCNDRVCLPCRRTWVYTLLSATNSAVWLDWLSQKNITYAWGGEGGGEEESVQVKRYFIIGSLNYSAHLGENPRLHGVHSELGHWYILCLNLVCYEDLVWCFPQRNPTRICYVCIPVAKSDLCLAINMYPSQKEQAIRILWSLGNSAALRKTTHWHSRGH